MFALSRPISCTKNRCTEKHDYAYNIGDDLPQPATLPSKGCTRLNRATGSTLIESRPPYLDKQRAEIAHDVATNHHLSGHLNGVVLNPNSSPESFQKGEMYDDTSFQHPITHVLSNLAQKSIQRARESGSYQNAAALLAAVSTPSDAYTAFEQELLEEINRLRSDPASYAALVEKEATLGYPFICMEDEYYATDGAASNAHEYHSDSLLEAVARVSRTTCPHSREDISLLLCTRNASEPQANHQLNEQVAQTKNQKLKLNSLMQQVPPPPSGASCPGSEPLSTRVSNKSRGRSARISAVIQNRLNKFSTSTGNQGVHANTYTSATSSTGSPPKLFLQPTNDATTIHSTLKKQGLTEMTLEQLGIHLRRHELHRFALEKAAEDILIRWHLAQLALQDALNAEDDRIGKKVGKGQHATAKESMAGCAPSLRATAFPQTGPHRKSHERATNVEGHHQRFEAAEKLRSIFAAHLRTILEKLCVEHWICKRTMDGANLILECVHALRQVYPVPPLLPRRGLHLAARNVSLFHHALGDCVTKAPTSSSSNVLTPSSENLRNGREVQFLPFLSNQHENFLASIQESTDVNSVHVLKEWVKNQKNQATNFFNTNTHLLAHQLSVETISNDISCIARMIHEASGKYGRVANELRGVQLYGSGKPREVIIRAILGVLVPQFVLHGMHFHETVKRDAAEAVDQLLTDQEILRLFKFSIFSGSSQHGETDCGTALEGNHIADEAYNTTECTGIMLCGTYHPTTMRALIQRLLEQDSDPTSKGKRVVGATHRLGPLLWRDARVVGIGWQRACRPLTYDDPDKSSFNTGGSDEKDRTLNSDYVCTTIVLATEYEELELIATNKHASLEEVNRIVQQCQEVNNFQPENFFLPILTDCSTLTEGVGAIKDASQFITSTTVADPPVMVDLHSNLDVQVVYPRCHPLVLEADFISRHPGVVVVVLRADRRRVQVRACLSTSSSLNSSLVSFSRPNMLSSREILVQRSVSDRDAVLIMIDTMSVTNELLQTTQIQDAGFGIAISNAQEDSICFLQIFEREVKVGDACSDKIDDAVMGYTFIGFIRLVFQRKTTLPRRDRMLNHSQRKLLVSTDTGLQGTTCASAQGSAVQAAFGLRLTEAISPGTRKGRNQRSELTLQGGGASVACGVVCLPPLYEPFLAHLDFSSRATPLECFHDGLITFDSARDASWAAIAGTCGGWPEISAEFTDRGGCILSPLISVLPPNSNNTPVRFSVYLPDDYQTSGIALQQKEALLALLHSLDEIEAAEALRESTDIALMREEAQDQGDSSCGPDTESKEKVGDLSRGDSLRGEVKEEVTVGIEIQVEDAVSKNACLSVDGDGDRAHSTAFGTKKAHQKVGPTRSKKALVKGIVDDGNVSPGSHKRPPKATSPDKRRTESLNLKAEQKGLKVHPSSHGNLSSLKQSSPREPLNPAIARLQDSSLSCLEDGNLDLIRLFDSPPSKFDSAPAKKVGSVPQALSHDILMSISLARLRSLVDEQTRSLSGKRELLVRIEGILCDELQRLEAEILKRKGRELIKLKRDEEDINQQLEHMRKIVQNYEVEAQCSKEILTRRTRDQTLRRARLKHVRAQLAALFGLKCTTRDTLGSSNNSPRIVDAEEPSSTSSLCDVVVWFVPKDSVPHALRLASRSPATRSSVHMPSARRFAMTQDPIISNLNNIVQLKPVVLGDHPQFHCYEATVQIPTTLRGYAVLLVNGYECALWEV